MERRGPTLDQELLRWPCSLSGWTCVSCRGCRSEEHTSELQSPCNLVCRLLLEKKKKIKYQSICFITYLLLSFYILNVVSNSVYYSSYNTPLHLVNTSITHSDHIYSTQSVFSVL